MGFSSDKSKTDKPRDKKSSFRPKGEKRSHRPSAPPPPAQATPVSAPAVDLDDLATKILSALQPQMRAEMTSQLNLFGQQIIEQVNNSITALDRKLDDNIEAVKDQIPDQPMEVTR